MESNLFAWDASFFFCIAETIVISFENVKGAVDMLMKPLFFCRFK